MSIVPASQVRNLQKVAGVSVGVCCFAPPMAPPRAPLNGSAQFVLVNLQLLHGLSVTVVTRMRLT